MSRSYKHVPGFTEGYGGKSRSFFKKEASRKSRRYKNLPDGGAFKKVYETYNIIDYHFLAFTRRDWVHWGSIEPITKSFKDLNNLNKENYKSWIK